MSMVRCTHCRKTYDLGMVEPYARYSDATCFKTPCCGRDADDRKWKSPPDFQEIRPDRDLEARVNQALAAGQTELARHLQEMREVHYYDTMGNYTT